MNLDKEMIAPLPSRAARRRLQENPHVANLQAGKKAMIDLVGEPLGPMGVSLAGKCGDNASIKFNHPFP